MRPLHFNIRNPQGIVDLVRQGYYMEKRQEWALDTLRCFEGITDKQIQSILAGDATLVSRDKGRKAAYVEADDKKWKKELSDYLTWHKSRFIVLAGHEVSKELLEEYANDVVKRIRNAIRSPGLMRYTDPILLMELEEKRQQQHKDICGDAGFKADREGEFERTKEFVAFSEALQDYLDEKAGSLYLKAEARGR